MNNREVINLSRAISNYKHCHCCPSCGSQELSLAARPRTALTTPAKEKRGFERIKKSYDSVMKDYSSFIRKNTAEEALEYDLDDNKFLSSLDSLASEIYTDSKVMAAKHFNEKIFGDSGSAFGTSKVLYALAR